MAILRFCLLGLLVLVGGCASHPPKFVTTAHDPLLDKNGGVVLFVDTCIKRGAVVSGDCVVVEESRAGAEALLDVVRNYLSANGVRVRTAFIPFVCGALADSENSPQKVANNLNDNVRDGQRPFDVSEDLGSDSNYVHALTKVGTFAFQHPFLPKQEVTSASNDSTDKQMPLVTVEQFRAATAIVAAKTQASSILYIGVSGLSRSTGQNILRGIGSAIIGTVVGVATGGIIVMPGPVPDSRLMSAALIDLETAEVEWSNAVRAHGDPVKPDVIAAQSPIELLLSHLVHKEASTWSPPGIAPAL